MTYLVDTNVLSETTRRTPDARALAWIERQPELVASVISLQELEFGIRTAPVERQPALRQWLDALRDAGALRTLPVDDRVAAEAAAIRADRRKSGRTVPLADVLIAATARASGRILVTRNVRDFEGFGVAVLDPFSG